MATARGGTGSGGGPRAATAVRAVLFDLDGTLIDTRRLYLECYRRAVEPYLGRGLSREEIQGLKPRSEVAFLRAVAGEEALERCREDFHREYERLYPTHFGGVYGGVRELLEALRDLGVPLGIVTGKSRRSWESTLAREELGAFDVLVFEDDVASPKPHPEGLLRAISALELEPEVAVYVGDTMGDVRAARAAGVRPLAAAWARLAEDVEEWVGRVLAAGATVLRRPKDLLALPGLDGR